MADWNPTNANDVTIIVRQAQADATGGASITETGSAVVDDFSIDTEEDLESLSGVGNNVPQGISAGDIEYSFSFTLQGEDGDVVTGLVKNDSGKALEAVALDIQALFDTVSITLEEAYAGTRNISGSSGDPTEMEVEGIAKRKAVESR